MASDMAVVGGYDPEVIPFVEKPPEDLECPLCLVVLKNPFLVECCGHHFCETCIGRVKAAGQPCPMCSNPIPNMILDRKTMRLVEGLKVYCKERRKGCQWIGELRYSNEHIPQCMFSMMECSYGCKQQFPRHEWENHMESCPRSPVEVQLRGFRRSVDTRLAALERNNERYEEAMTLIYSLQQKINGLTTEREVLMKKMVSQNADLQEAINTQNIYKKQVDQLHHKVEQLTKQANDQSDTIATIHRVVMKDVREILEKEMKSVNSIKETVPMIHEAVMKDVQDLVDSELKDVRSLQANIVPLIQKNVTAEVHKYGHSIANSEASQPASVMVLPTSTSVTSLHSPSIAPSSLSTEPEELAEQLDLTTLQLGLLRQDHKQLSSSTEKRLRALTNDVAMNRQAIADRAGGKESDWRATMETTPSWQAAMDTSSQFPVPPVEFTMTNYIRCKHTHNLWFSPPFYSAYRGYKMLLRVDAFGVGDGKGTHLSLYVCIVKGQYDEKLVWPVKGEMVVQLLNWKDNSKHVRELVGFSGNRITSDTAVGHRPKGKGRHQFATHRVIESTADEMAQYIQNDCLRLQVDKINIPDFTPVDIALKTPRWETNCVFPCEFTMTNFEHHRKTEISWYSDPFYSHYSGYKMCIRLDANGDGRGKGSHISLYVSLMKGENDDRLSWPFRGEVKIVMLNWCEDANHIKEKITFSKAAGDQVCGRVTQGSRALIGRGRNQFLPHADMGLDKERNVQYCRNDCLRLRVKRVIVLPNSD